MKDQAGKKQPDKRRTVEINTALERVIAHNERLDLNSIELFSEVYYPVALLEIEMTETTFEDFELVPLTMMRFVHAGARSAQDIASLSGLSANYVQKVLNLLMGYGYMDEIGLTDLGLQSMQQEKKIAHTAVKQLFKADAITGDLLKLGEQPADEDLQGARGTFHVIPHLPHIEGVSVDALNRQLTQSDLTEYKRYRGDILNANADEIHSVSCVGLEYVRAYLMKLTGLDAPVIIMYRYDPTQKNFRERYRWQPVRVPSEAAYEKYGFDRGIPCYTDEALYIVNDLYKLVCKQVTEMGADKLKKLLQHAHPFDYDTMDISLGRIMDGVPEQITVYLNASSFTKWNAFVLKFLAQYDPDRGYLYTDSHLNGLFVRFETQNNDIRRAAKTYQGAIRKAKRDGNQNALNTFIRNRLFHAKERKRFVMGELSEVIDAYEEENKE